jgi:hypothetical protein
MNICGAICFAIFLRVTTSRPDQLSGSSAYRQLIRACRNYQLLGEPDRSHQHNMIMREAEFSRQLMPWG